MNFTHHRPGLRTRAAHFSLAMASAAALLTAGVSVVTALPARATAMREVAEALRLRLPRTPIDALDCMTFRPWCEVVSDRSLFYIDETARYLFVGRLFDMQERRDVTAARLLAVNPDMLAAAAARAAGNTPGGQEDKAAPTTKAAPDRVDLASLPKDGAIAWGEPDGPTLVVFSDFRCGYCRRLSGELARAGVRVEERPVSILGAESRRLSEAVVCARDPVAALHAAYAGSEPAQSPDCNAARALDANEAFARASGFAGTPVIVRARDGAVLHGYRDAVTLRRFAGTEAAR